MAHIDFALVDKKGKETWHTRAACFASGNWDSYDEKDKPKYVIYKCINNCNRSEAAFWIATFAKFLDTDKYEVYPNADWKIIMFVLDVSKMPYRNKALLYLTFFRYLYEGNGFVAKFYSKWWREKRTDSSAFIDMIELHKKCEHNKELPMWGHSLFSSGYDAPRPAINLKDFKANLKLDLSVVSHFK